MPELRGLLDAASAFPAGPWAQPSILATLSVLGLQTAVGPAALLEVARQIEATSVGSPAAAAARCVEGLQCPLVTDLDPGS